MSRYAKPMSQVLAEMKMNDPKLNKIFDKLKKGDKIKLKTSSTISKGSDFVEYIVKSKNVVNKGRVEKITLATVGNEKAVKKFLYRRDGKVTFAMGDMAASIDDIKEELEEGYESEVLKVLDDAGIDGYFRNGKLYVDKRDANAAKSALEDADNIMKLPKMVKEEVEDLDEMFDYVLLDKDNKIAGRYSGKNAKKEAESGKKSAHLPPMSIPKNEVGKMKIVPISPKDKKDIGDMVLAIGEVAPALVTIGKAAAAGAAGSAVDNIMSRTIDPADVDDDATDADKKSADKNMIMQMRKAMDVKGNMKIEFGDGKKEKVDPKILQLMITAHGKIQKPRDKEKFVAMISKSKRDMLMVAKKIGSLKMGEELKLVEGTWKMPDNPKEVAALKKLMSRPLPIGNTEDDKMYKDSASAKLYGLLGDDELFDALGALEDKGKEKADARPVIIKWFQQRVKDDSYGLGDETKDLGKQIGLKMEYIPEGFSPKEIKMAIGIASDPRYKQGNYTGAFKAIEKIKKGLASHPQVAAVLKRQNENLDEKYELYHKSFSDAMQHAYDYAKKKLGITVDPKEIDSKVATGPKKPSEGKTNKYRLKGKGGNLQIQVYNKGGSKPFELNMYKEENEMTKSLKDTIVEMWSEAVSPAQQAAIAISKKEKGEEPKDEGNAFGAALKAAREKGDETFVVAGKTYKCEDYDEKGQVKEFVQADGVKRRVKEGDNRLKANRTETNKNNKSDDGDGLDAVQPKAVKKKFKDRIDKDIDNDGDVDDSDKFLHKRRKAVSKAIKSEEVELDENYRKLAMKGIGTETKKAAKVGLKTDYYLPKNGDKSFGKITRVTSSGYEITDEKTKEVHKFKFYDADNDPTSVRGIKSAYSESIQRYHETKKGSLRDTVLQMWGEISEKVEYVEYKFKSERDAKAAKQHLDGMKMMSFDINDDNIRGGELSVDAGKKDMTKAHKEIMQKFKPKVMKTEKNDLTKEKKNGTKNMTDTGKEVTPVEMSPKMPKIKETKNKV